MQATRTLRSAVCDSNSVLNEGEGIVDLALTTFPCDAGLLYQGFWYAVRFPAATYRMATNQASWGHFAFCAICLLSIASFLLARGWHSRQGRTFLVAALRLLPTATTFAEQLSRTAVPLPGAAAAAAISSSTTGFSEIPYAFFLFCVLPVPLPAHAFNSALEFTLHLAPQLLLHSTSPPHHVISLALQYALFAIALPYCLLAAREHHAVRARPQAQQHPAAARPAPPRQRAAAPPPSKPAPVPAPAPLEIAASAASPAQPPPPVAAAGTGAGRNHSSQHPVGPPRGAGHVRTSQHPVGPPGGAATTALARVTAATDHDGNATGPPSRVPATPDSSDGACAPVACCGPRAAGAVAASAAQPQHSRRKFLAYWPLAELQVVSIKIHDHGAFDLRKDIITAVEACLGHPTMLHSPTTRPTPPYITQPPTRGPRTHPSVCNPPPLPPPPCDPICIKAVAVRGCLQLLVGIHQLPAPFTGARPLPTPLPAAVTAAIRDKVLATLPPAMRTSGVTISSLVVGPGLRDAGCTEGVGVQLEIEPVCVMSGVEAEQDVEVRVRGLQGVGGGSELDDVPGGGGGWVEAEALVVFRRGGLVGTVRGPVNADGREGFGAVRLTLPPALDPQPLSIHILTTGSSPGTLLATRPTLALPPAPHNDLTRALTTHASNPPTLQCLHELLFDLSLFLSLLPTTPPPPSSLPCTSPTPQPPALATPSHPPPLPNNHPNHTPRPPPAPSPHSSLIPQVQAMLDYLQAMHLDACHSFVHRDILTPLLTTLHSHPQNPPQTLFNPPPSSCPPPAITPAPPSPLCARPPQHVPTAPPCIPICTPTTSTAPTPTQTNPQTSAPTPHASTGPPSTLPPTPPPSRPPCSTPPPSTHTPSASPTTTPQTTTTTPPTIATATTFQAASDAAAATAITFQAASEAAYEEWRLRQDRRTDLVGAAAHVISILSFILKSRALGHMSWVQVIRWSLLHTACVSTPTLLLALGSQWITRRRTLLVVIQGLGFALSFLAAAGCWLPLPHAALEQSSQVVTMTVLFGVFLPSVNRVSWQHQLLITFFLVELPRLVMMTSAPCTADNRPLLFSLNISLLSATLVNSLVAAMTSLLIGRYRLAAFHTMRKAPPAKVKAA